MFWNEVVSRREIFLQNFGKGLNTYEDPTRIDPEELTDCLNVSCDDYPVIRTRNDRVWNDADVLTNPRGIGARGSSYIHVVADNTWKYKIITSTAWTDITTTLSTLSNQASFHEFRTYALTTDASTGDRLTYTIAAYVNSSNNQNGYWTADSTFEFFSTSYTEPSSGSIYTNYPPQSNLMTVHKYRVYGFDHDLRTLRFSELGNPLWYKAENYLDITEMRGIAKAITAFADHIIVWGENSMHELYGESNFNFELINVSNTIGCVGKYAHTECEGRLYWMDNLGLFMYTGGLPRPVGLKAKGYFDQVLTTDKYKISLGNFESKLYITLPIYNSTQEYKTVVIDVKDIANGYELVTVEDECYIKNYVNIRDKLYALHNDGRVWNMNSTLRTGYDNSTAISWSFEGKPLTDDGFDLNSCVRDVWVQYLRTDTNSSLNLKYSTHSHSTAFSTFMASTDFIYSTDLRRTRFFTSSTELQLINFLKWQFSGEGYCKIYGIQSKIVSFGNQV